MSRHFWSLAVAYHVVVCIAALSVAALFARVIRNGGRGAFVGIVGLMAIFGLVVVVTADIAARWLPDQRFAMARLVCQALFGETPVLLTAMAMAHLRRRMVFRGLLFGGALVALLGVHWEAYLHGPENLKVRRYELRLPGSALGRSLRVAHLTDIQSWRVGDLEERAIRETMSSKPDLIVMTGDYLQERLVPSRSRAARDLRALLRRERFGAPLGVFAVWGNTDGRNRWLFDGLNVRVLEDETARVSLPGGRTLNLVGLDWRTSFTRDPRPIARVLRRARPADYCFVLGHAPDYVTSLSESFNVDLALAGHTHGGQVQLPIVGPPVLLSHAPQRVASGGLHDLHGTNVHVARGIGMERGSAPQIRFLCPPEVGLLDVRY